MARVMRGAACLTPDLLAIIMVLLGRAAGFHDTVRLSRAGARPFSPLCPTEKYLL